MDFDGNDDTLSLVNENECLSSREMWIMELLWLAAAAAAAAAPGPETEFLSRGGGAALAELRGVVIAGCGCWFCGKFMVGSTETSA